MFLYLIYLISYYGRTSAPGHVIGKGAPAFFGADEVHSGSLVVCILKCRGEHDRMY